MINREGVKRTDTESSHHKEKLLLLSVSLRDEGQPAGGIPS